MSITLEEFLQELPAEEEALAREFKAFSRSRKIKMVVIDGSTGPGPGATDTGYRLPIALDWVNLELIHVEVTDKYPGERLDYYPLPDGDVALVDRAYNQPGQRVEQGARGVGVVLRYNPHSMT